MEIRRNPSLWIFILYYDLTPYLRYDDKNIIAVRVDNSQQKIVAGTPVQVSIGMCG